MKRNLPPIGDTRRTMPRYIDTRAEDERKLAKILLETGAEQKPAERKAKQFPGDNERALLRGIPVCGFGGTSPGTDPLTELLRNIR